MENYDGGENQYYRLGKLDKFLETNYFDVDVGFFVVVI
jgi:hypothetical protein